MPSSTVIPAHTRVEGRITTAADLRVEGHCEGDIEAGGLVTVARDGVCRAGIRAHAAEIHGDVIGNVVCAARIVVTSGGRVVGDLRAPDIEVDARAEVDGRVDLLPPAPREAPVKRVRLHTRGHGVRRPAPPRPTDDEPTSSDTGRPIPEAPRPRGRKRVAPRDTGRLD